MSVLYHTQIKTIRLTLKAYYLSDKKTIKAVSIQQFMVTVLLSLIHI